MIAEEVLSINLTVRVQTNKRERNWTIEGVSLAEFYGQIDKIIDRIEGMNE